MMQNIIGYYKNYLLVEKGKVFYVVNRQEKKIVFKGNEETANKMFIMLAAKFIDENLGIEA